MSTKTCSGGSSGTTWRWRASWPVHFEPLRTFLVALAFLQVSAQGATGLLVSNAQHRGCVCSYDPSVDYFPVKVEPNFAETWTVSYHKHYKILTDVSSSVPAHYVLHQCGTPEPEASSLPAGAELITIPVRRAAFDSGVFSAYLDMIGQRESLSWYTYGPEYLASACLLQHIESGQTATGFGLNVDVDVAFLGFGAGTWSGPGTAVAMHDAREQHPLGRIEHMELVSLFFNREEAAQAVVDTIESRYQCAKQRAADSAAQTGTTKKLLYFGAYSTPWAPPDDCSANPAVFTLPGHTTDGSGTRVRTTDLRVMLDASAELLDVDPSLSGPDLRAAILAAAAEADAIVMQLDAEKWDSPGELCAAEMQAFFADLRAAVAQGAAARGVAPAGIYDIYRTARALSSGTGFGTDFFLGLQAEPDVFLLDAISALRPEALNSNSFPHERRFLRRVMAADASLNEDRLLVSADQCEDNLEPFFSKWESSACAPQGTPPAVPGRELFKPERDLCCASGQTLVARQATLARQNGALNALAHAANALADGLPLADGTMDLHTTTITSSGSAGTQSVNNPASFSIGNFLLATNTNGPNKFDYHAALMRAAVLMDFREADAAERAALGHQYPTTTLVIAADGEVSGEVNGEALTKGKAFDRACSLRKVLREWTDLIVVCLVSDRGALSKKTKRTNKCVCDATFNADKNLDAAVSGQRMANLACRNAFEVATAVESPCRDPAATAAGKDACQAIKGSSFGARYKDDPDLLFRTTNVCSFRQQQCQDKSWPLLAFLGGQDSR